MALRSIGLTAVLSLALSAAHAGAQLRDAAHYEIMGVWSEGVLRATGIEPPEDPVRADEADVEGRVDALDLEKKLLHIGPVAVQWSDATKFVKITPADLKITTYLEIEGRIVGSRRLIATAIERGPPAFEPNFLKILAPVTGVKRNADGSARLEIMGVPAVVPAEIYRELQGARSDADEEEEDETPAAAGVKIEGEYEIKLDYQNGFALEKRAKDDRLRLDQEFQLRLFYRHSDRMVLLVEGKVFGEHELYAERGRKPSAGVLERGETWVRFDKLFGRDLTLKVGRQNFEEPRRWWWDDDLDAVAVRYRHESWSFELGIAREFLPTSTPDSFVDPENEDVLRVLARADWRYSKNHRLSFFFLHQNDDSRTPSIGALITTEREDESDATLRWGGLRAMGRWPATGYGDFSYWADAAAVLGKEELLELEDEPGGFERVTDRIKRRVGGWAVDVGGRWSPGLPGRPTFILAYALGSGDKNPESGADRAFRQTGLQSNDEEFRTYGELLRPELSNLHIAAAAVQFPMFVESHVEFAYRHFRQHYAAPFLRDARIEADPTGVSKRIGQEWMIYLGIKEWEHVEIECVGAAFRAGRAYGGLAGRMAYTLFTQVTFSF